MQFDSISYLCHHFKFWIPLSFPSDLLTTATSRPVISPKYINVSTISSSLSTFINITLNIHTKFLEWSQIIIIHLKANKHPIIPHGPIISPGVIQQKPNIILQTQGLYCRIGMSSHKRIWIFIQKKSESAVSFPNESLLGDGMEKIQDSHVKKSVSVGGG